MGQVVGTYANCQASSSTANATLSAGTISTVTAAIGATESLYHVLDFRVNVSSGVPTAGSTVDIYRRNGDGTNQAPAPQTADFLHEFVGSAVLDNQTGYYYRTSVANPDPNDSYYMVNSGGATLTLVLAVRGRNYG